jgi:glycogen synthase
MKILLGSHHFAPSIGGIETASELLARELVKLGHEVRVMTQTPGEADFPFAVIRQPGAREVLRQVSWCDVFLQNNISLRTVWPLLLVRRPLFVVHQTWIRNARGAIGWQQRLKRFVLRFASSIAISKAVADDLPTDAVIIPNPYDDEIFRRFEGTDRARDLVYVGRLVSDKGVDLLIEALSILREAGTDTRLTVVGDGADRSKLEKQVAERGLQSSVEFVGSVNSLQLAEILNHHRILVVPSRWPEPFGIVALEGIACGCAVVGSDQGGLPEVIGPCGVTCPNNDARALAGALGRLIDNPGERDALRGNASAHLARFTKRRVAEAYSDFVRKNL